ncbi:MAG TPA: glycosyltransferase [Steroidobacteraceae bacterium]|jgi:glycosyltransferase involved in cell wall biosynthesis|nr:glycosyltransferase [Steroidobacteraceae bacterium]
MTRVSAVVPARDERPTLAGVLRPLLAHPMVDEVIVADDASVDGTAELARELGARVVRLPDNGGKAAAMALGVAAARNDVILFCDADLIGLSEEAITRIVEPVLRGDCAMFVGIRGRRSYWANRLLHFTPILGGERALLRSLWEEVPASYKRNFQIEIALNFFAKANGHRMDFTVIHGLRQVIKERKRGLLRGMVQRLSMVADIVIVSWRLYVVLQPQLMLRALPGRSYRSS